MFIFFIIIKLYELQYFIIKCLQSNNQHDKSADIKVLLVVLLTVTYI